MKLVTDTDVRNATSVADQRRKTVWDFVSEHFDYLWDDPTYSTLNDPDIIAIIARRLAPEMNRAAGGGVSRNRLESWLAPWFRDPHRWSPYPDLLAVERFLEGDATVAPLTDLEARIAAQVVHRLTWDVWRYGTPNYKVVAKELGLTDGRVKKIRDERHEMRIGNLGEKILDAFNGRVNTIARQASAS